MKTLTPETIAYICEWAKSGNEWRLDTLAPELTQAFLNELTEECDFGFRLNSVALTIAQLAEDLEKEIVLRDQWQNNHDDLTVDYDKALRENAALKAALEQAKDMAAAFRFYEDDTAREMWPDDRCGDLTQRIVELLK